MLAGGFFRRYPQGLILKPRVLYDKDMEEILIKIFLAIVLGGALGMERQYHDKPAGYATNCLICVGAMLFTILSEYMGDAGGDPGRIAAQVVTGVGFIGAGSILRDGNKISGLTTAAGVWLVAAIGMTVGYGQYMLAMLTACAILVFQLGARKTIKFVERLRRYDSVNLVCEPNWQTVEKISATLEKQNVTVLKQEVTKQENRFHVYIIATFSGSEFQNVTKELLEMPEVYSLYK